MKEKFSSLYRLLWNKYWVDEIYDLMHCASAEGRVSRPAVAGG
jgi:hypothetical protein